MKTTDEPAAGSEPEAGLQASPQPGGASAVQRPQQTSHWQHWYGDKLGVPADPTTVQRFRESLPARVLDVEAPSDSQSATHASKLIQKLLAPPAPPRKRRRKRPGRTIKPKPGPTESTDFALKEREQAKPHSNELVAWTTEEQQQQQLGQSEPLAPMPRRRNASDTDAAVSSPQPPLAVPAFQTRKQKCQDAVWLCEKLFPETPAIAKAAEKERNSVQRNFLRELVTLRLYNSEPTIAKECADRVCKPGAPEEPIVVTPMAGGAGADNLARDKVVDWVWKNFD